MNAIDEIEDAIRKLPDEAQATLRAWFAEFDAATWDRQFERDVADGRLDALADEALRDRREGCRLPSPWIRKHAAVTDAARYIKLVEWSEEDGAFVGQCPGIIGPCCHGSDEVEVYRELCEIVEEWIEIARREGRPLPPATAGTGFARPMA